MYEICRLSTFSLSAFTALCIMNVAGVFADGGRRTTRRPGARRGARAAPARPCHEARAAALTASKLNIYIQ